MTSAHLKKVAIRTLDESLATLVDELLAVLHFRLHRLQFVVTLAVLGCKHQHTQSTHVTSQLASKQTFECLERVDFVELLFSYDDVTFRVEAGSRGFAVVLEFVETISRRVDLGFRLVNLRRCFAVRRLLLRQYLYKRCHLSGTHLR